MLYLNISQRITDQKLRSEIKYFLTELKNFLSTGILFKTYIDRNNCK